MVETLLVTTPIRLVISSSYDHICETLFELWLNRSNEKLS